MEIDKFIDEYNSRAEANKSKFLANLHKKAEAGDMTALFLAGYFQSPTQWEVMKKAALSGDPVLYYNYICVIAENFGLSPAKDREIHQLCYRGRQMKYAPILNRLAITYLCGIGCKQNLKLAKKYFFQALELGSAEAAHNLVYIECKNLDFWTEQRRRYIHLSLLPEPGFSGRCSIMLCGTPRPGKTTFRTVIDNNE